MDSIHRHIGKVQWKFYKPYGVNFSVHANPNNVDISFNNKKILGLGTEETLKITSTNKTITNKEYATSEYLMRLICKE